MTPEVELKMIQTISRIESRLEDMHDRLFGNGQPGLLADTEARVIALELTKSKVQGAFYVLYTGFGVLASWISVRFFQGK